MATKQTDTVAMTEEQLDTVVGGYNNGQDAAVLRPARGARRGLRQSLWVGAGQLVRPGRG